MRFRRDVVEDMEEGIHDMEEEVKEIEHELEEELAPVAETLHVAPWMLLAGIATAVLVLIGVGAWCAWRFLKKKRPQGQDVMADDEQDLVGNEEAEPEEIEEVQQNTDFKGRIHYRLEYDFTTQELKVTVIIIF